MEATARRNLYQAIFNKSLNGSYWEKYCPILHKLEEYLDHEEARAWADAGIRCDLIEDPYTGGPLYIEGTLFSWNPRFLEPGEPELEIAGKRWFYPDHRLGQFFETGRGGRPLYRKAQ